MPTSSQAWLCLISIVTFYAINVAALDARYCLTDKGNYTDNSTYAVNLRTLLSSLSLNINDTGYYKASMGRAQDEAYAMALCRADIQLNECRFCVQNASGDLLNRCPNNNHAIVYRDTCTVRYSNDSFFGIRLDDPNIVASSVGVVKFPDQFVENLTTLLDDLRIRTAWSALPIKVAAGNHTAPALQMIYAIVQCVPDISPDGCSDCLTAAFGQIPGCCYDAQLVMLFLPSCNFHYDVKPFYNATRVEDVQRMLSGPGHDSKPSPPSAGQHGDNRAQVIAIIVILTVVCITVIATCIGGMYMRNRIKKKAKETMSSHILAENESDRESLQYDFGKLVEDGRSIESLQYDFGTIRAATNDFVNKLGQGGFGSVYKGTLPDGQEIAVKRLTPGLVQGDAEFKNEVLLMAKLQHRNLVRLLGFALEGNERLLVYEFIKNTSLDHFIFDPTKGSHINWDVRQKIIGGVARGLLYLHEDSHLRIIHRDLKAGNVLLDGDMNAKIADFGISRLIVQDESAVITSKIVGTPGYIAPEYMNHGEFSVKSDVFSFGILVLEIVSGQRNQSFRHGEDGVGMLNFVWRNWRAGTPENFLDPVLKSTPNSLLDMLRCIHIGLLCVQEDPTVRPTMVSIVVNLNSVSNTLPLPSQPAFINPVIRHPMYKIPAQAKP